MNTHIYIGIKSYGWQRHDGRNFGIQNVKDSDIGVEITTSFVKTVCWHICVYMLICAYIHMYVCTYVFIHMLIVEYFYDQL